MDDNNDKRISRWVDRETLIYVRWDGIKNRSKRKRRWQIEEKEGTEWSKVSQKQVRIRRVFFHHTNCETMHMSSRILSD